MTDFDYKELSNQDMQIAVARMKKELPMILEFVKIMAQLRKAGYDALIKEGFNEQQALCLCENLTQNPGGLE